MKVWLVFFTCMVFAAGQIMAEEKIEPKTQKDEGKIELKTEKDRVNYAIGIDTGQKLKDYGFDIDPVILLKGIKDKLLGEKPLMNELELRETMTSAQKEIMAKMQARRKALEEKQKALGEKNKKEGPVFLAKNKQLPGVITLPSGLQYKVIKEGKGESPKLSDTVTVHYRGTSIDGTEFDNTYKFNHPAVFTLSSVIQGWVEALQLMKEGAKWQLFIPSNLAFGENVPLDAPLSPNMTQIYDIELLKVEHKEPTPPPWQRK